MSEITGCGSVLWAIVMFLLADTRAVQVSGGEGSFNSNNLLNCRENPVPDRLSFSFGGTAVNAFAHGASLPRPPRVLVRCRHFRLVWGAFTERLRRGRDRGVSFPGASGIDHRCLGRERAADNIGESLACLRVVFGRPQDRIVVLRIEMRPSIFAW